MSDATASCFRLLVHLDLDRFAFAFASAGSSIPARIAIDRNQNEQFDERKTSAPPVKRIITHKSLVVYKTLDMLA